jgi:hypothetical protein
VFVHDCGGRDHQRDDQIVKGAFHSDASSLVEAAVPAGLRPWASRSVGMKSRRERIPQQHHVIDMAYLGQRRPPVWVPRKPAVTNKPPGL